MISVAVVGTQGVPANYGGFESLVENMIGENCPDDIRYTVFCSSADMDSAPAVYKGAELRYVHVHAHGVHSMPYDFLSMLRAARGFDVIFILGVSGCLFLPLLRRVTSARIVTNIDGMEWRRDKWGPLARAVLRRSEAAAVRHSDVVVADNEAIREYVTRVYGRDSEMIAYGGDHALRDVAPQRVAEILDSYGVEAGSYALSVCRIEPENKCDVVLEALSRSRMPLLMVGNWSHSPWARALRSRYSGCPNIRMADAVYDLDTLFALRSKAAIYIHGYSAGGTNPSLVEAMHFGIPVAAWDVVFNRRTTEGHAYYFSTPEELLEICGSRDLSGEALKSVARKSFTWATVARQYCDLFRKITR